MWIVGSDGTGAHELFPGGTDPQVPLAWSPDGSLLLYVEDAKLWLAEPGGGQPQAVDTGCSAPSPETPLSCQQDSQPAFSRDGRRIVFVRESTDADGYLGPAAIATMDLESGRVTVLTATAPIGGMRPGWSPDGTHILFSRFGSKDENGPFEPTMDAVFVIDADGQNLQQVSPPSIDAFDAEWSPDGARIVFVSRNPSDPEGLCAAGLRRSLHDASRRVGRAAVDDGRARVCARRGRPTDGSCSRTDPAARAEGDPGWWTMDADGSNAALLAAAATIGVHPGAVAVTHPAWQPVGGPAIAALPWTPAPAIAVGPAAPTPSPSPVPDLAPGFTLAGTPTTDEDGPLGETSTKLADGRVLVTEGCGTAAALYDPIDRLVHARPDPCPSSGRARRRRCSRMAAS